MEPRATARTAVTVLTPFWRREAQVVHQEEGRHQGHPEQDRAQHEGDTEIGELGDDTAEHRPGEHGHAADGLPAPKDRLEVAGESCRVERVDQPRFRGATEEGEAQAEQDGSQRPAGEGRLHLPHAQVEQRGGEQRRRAEQERETPAPGVGHHARGHLEDDHADGEERIRREGLGVVEAGVEQEQRVDAPDEGGGQRREHRQQQVDALDVGGCRAHRGTRGHIGVLTLHAGSTAGHRERYRGSGDAPDRPLLRAPPAADLPYVA